MPKTEALKSSELSNKQAGRRSQYGWVFDPSAPTDEERRHQGFDELVDDAIPLFWAFVLEGPVDLSTENGKGLEVTLVDLHRREKKKFLKGGGWSVPEQLIRQGYVPGAPSHGKIAFSFELMVLYEHMRDAFQLAGMDSAHFVRSLCDLHSVKYIPSMRTPFERAFELVYTPIIESSGPTKAGEAIRAKYPVPPKDELTRIFGEKKMRFYNKSIEEVVAEISADLKK